MTRSLVWIAGTALGLALLFSLIALAAGGGGIELPGRYADFAGIAPAAQSSGVKEWNWTGGDRLEIDAPADVNYVAGGAPRIIVRADSETLKDVRFGDGRLVYTRRGLFFFDRDNHHIDVTVRGVALHTLALNGSGHVALGALHQDRMTVGIAGSGTVTGGGQIGDLWLKISGSGRSNLDGLTAKTLRIDISGSGRTEARGRVDDLRISIAGSGRGRLGDLMTNTLRISIAGSGNVEVSARDSANISISGSGKVRFRQRPKVMTTSISGSGRILDANGVEIAGRHRHHDDN